MLAFIDRSLTFMYVNLQKLMFLLVEIVRTSWAIGFLSHVLILPHLDKKILIVRGFIYEENVFLFWCLFIVGQVQG